VGTPRYCGAREQLLGRPWLHAQGSNGSHYPDGAELTAVLGALWRALILVVGLWAVVAVCPVPRLALSELTMIRELFTRG
jgi:hypothetical protein